MLVSVIDVAKAFLRDVRVVLVSGKGGPPGDSHARLVGDVRRSSVDCFVSSQILSIDKLSLTWENIVKSLADIIRLESLYLMNLLVSLVRSISNITEPLCGELVVSKPFLWSTSKVKLLQPRYNVW